VALINNTKNLNDSYIIYGLNNCLNFFKSSNDYSLKLIALDKNGIAANNQEIISKISPYDNLVERLDTKDFNSRYNFKHSQGLVINFEGDLYSDLYSQKHFSGNSCIIIADQIKDPQNFGQIIRTAECAGVDGIIVPKHRSVHLSETVMQVSQGAFFHLNMYIETNLVSSIEFLKSQGFWVIGLENSIDSKEWHEIDYKGKVAIVIGSEGEGIRRLVKKSCDFLATIRMKGQINSLNVSAAVSAVLFERQRQLSK